MSERLTNAELKEFAQFAMGTGSVKATVMPKVLGHLLGCRRALDVIASFNAETEIERVMVQHAQDALRMGGMS